MHNLKCNMIKQKNVFRKSLIIEFNLVKNNVLYDNKYKKRIRICYNVIFFDLMNNDRVVSFWYDFTIILQVQIWMI
jgi:hypothetical protein